MNTIRKTLPPISERELQEYEASLGVRLPSEYREFLLEFNGGVPDNDSFLLPGESSYADSSVRSFFGVSAGFDNSLAYYLKIYVKAKRIHGDMLPIAEDYGGNIVVLAVKGPKVGHVLFWNHELEGTKPDSSLIEHLIPIAPSFSEFVDGLVPE